MNVNRVLTMDYEIMSNWAICENEPNQTQNKANFRGKKMLLRMTINTRRKSLGYYTDEIEAPNACDRAVAGCRLPGVKTRGGF